MAAQALPVQLKSSSMQSLDCIREAAFVQRSFCCESDGISEFTFANLYLFRHTHKYRICHLGNEGLRKAKIGYRPIDFVKKYRVTAV